MCSQVTSCAAASVTTDQAAVLGVSVAWTVPTGQPYRLAWVTVTRVNGTSPGVVSSTRLDMGNWTGGGVTRLTLAASDGRAAAYVVTLVLTNCFGSSPPGASAPLWGTLPLPLI